MAKIDKDANSEGEGLRHKQVTLFLTFLEVVMLIVGAFYSPLSLIFLIPVFLYFMGLSTSGHKIKPGKYWYLFLPFLLIILYPVYSPFFGSLNDLVGVSNIRTVASFLVFFVGVVMVMSAKLLKHYPGSEYHRNYTLITQIILLYLLYAVALILQVFFGKIQDIKVFAAFSIHFGWLPNIFIVTSIVLKLNFLLKNKSKELSDKNELPVLVKEFKGYEEKLSVLFEERKIYRRHDLDIEMVARRTGLSIAQFEYFLQKHVGKNYDLFVAEYRIAHALELMEGKDKQVYNTLDKIAYECGFNSRIVFDTFFSKITNSSPAEYMSNTRFVFLKTTSRKRFINV